jgi:hypothetical protein
MMKFEVCAKEVFQIVESFKFQVCQREFFANVTSFTAKFQVCARKFFKCLKVLVKVLFCDI